MLLVLYILQNKQIPQGATIVKLVTTQAGGQVTNKTLLSSQVAGVSQPNILGISSVQPHMRVRSSCCAQCEFFS